MSYTTAFKTIKLKTPVGKILFRLIRSAISLILLPPNINKDFEMLLRTLSMLTNSFFKTGISSEIDKIQKEIMDNMEFMDKICYVLSGYISDIGKAKNSGDMKVYLKKNDRDGYYISLTKLRAKSLKNNLNKKGKTIKITDNCKLKYNDL